MKFQPDYLKNATDCVELAEKTDDLKSQRRLFTIACAWLRLAVDEHPVDQLPAFTQRYLQ
jgi:hypothetical protein